MNDLDVSFEYDDEEDEYLCLIIWTQGFHTGYGKTQFEALKSAVEYLEEVFED